MNQANNNVKLSRLCVLAGTYDVLCDCSLLVVKCFPKKVVSSTI